MGLEELKKTIHDLKESGVSKETALETLKVALAKSMAATRKTGFSIGGGGSLGIGLNGLQNLAAMQRKWNTRREPMTFIY